MPSPGDTSGDTSGDTKAESIAVLDVDGVLADVGHRLHHITGSRRDWRAFLAGAGDDPVLPEGLAVAHECAARGLVVVYLSGRPERLRTTTLIWLRDNGFPAGNLHLRGDDDHRPNRVVKLGVLRRLARDNPIAIMVDDDPRVVADVERARVGTRRLAGAVLLADWAPRLDRLHDVQEAGGA